MTVYAVYTAAYTVTQQGGTGYTLSAESGTYTISGVRENKTVTVEGVAKKTGGKPSNPGGGDKEDKPEPESIGTTERTEKPSETEKEQQPEGDREQTVPASINNGKIIVSGGPVATGNVAGMTDTSTVLTLGNGSVIVTVVCAEQEYTAGVADTIAVANAVLTPGQQELVSGGREFYIIRAHEGEYTFMNDLDDAGGDDEAKCGLCHICPTFLGICCFIWLAVIIAVIVIVILLVLHRKKEEEPEEKR